MIVKDIYSHYRTPDNIQQHMLRVASLGSIVVANWIGKPIDSEAIISTLLFHDIAKLVTFEVADQVHFASTPQELEALVRDITYLVGRFGRDEHQVAIKIFQEIGLNAKAQNLIDNLEWHYTDQLIAENNLEALLTIYCDMRIGPKGILQVTDRILELHSRRPIENLEKRLTSARKLEDLMAKNVKIDLKTITNEQVNANTDQLAQKSVD
jgi:hypothetical protein